VDGVPGNLNNIDPNAIKSISFLKDAAAAAIYGARAAQGVIIVQTKEGTKGGIKVQYNSNYSLKTPTRFPEKNNSVENAKLANLAAENAGTSPIFAPRLVNLMKDPSVKAVPKEDGSDWDYVANFDWYKHFVKRSFQQKQNITLSGGGERNTFFISGAWLGDKGYFAKYGPDQYNRYSIRFNDSYQLIPDKLILHSNISFARRDRSSPSPGYSYLMNSLRQAAPSLPLFNPDGTYARYNMQQNTLQLLQKAGFNKKQKMIF
jgi:TonB-dependent SusC/RagA subfamily outer membrane receptor